MSDAIKRVVLARKIMAQLKEASYPGNIGIMELIKFMGRATTEQKKEFNALLTKGKHREVWQLIQQVTGVKLIESIKSGAGEEGTANLMNTYKKDTPEQNITRFKSYKRTK